MGRQTTISNEQQLVNRINSRQEFKTGRGVLSSSPEKACIHSSPNPSLHYKDVYKDVRAIMSKPSWTLELIKGVSGNYMVLATWNEV